MKEDKQLESLDTLIAWLLSTDRKAEMFDDVSKYGKLHYSIDELLVGVRKDLVVMDNAVNELSDEICRIGEKYNNLEWEQEKNNAK